MTDLLVHPSKPDSDGRVLSVTPQSAGWSYVGFELYRLDAGQVLSRETLGNETCLVIISGKARIKAGLGLCPFARKLQRFGFVGSLP